MQTALAKAWFARRRIVGDPEPYVRRIMVNEFASGRRRKWCGERPTAELPETYRSAAEPHTVSGYVGDDRPDRPNSAWCGDDPDTPAVPGVAGPAPGPWVYPDGLTLQPQDVGRTVHVELTQEVDENGDLLQRADEIGNYVPVDHPDAVLGVAIYAIADPVATVAGMEIRPLVGLDGQDYAYQGIASRGRSSGRSPGRWSRRPGSATTTSSSPTPSPRTRSSRRR